MTPHQEQALAVAFDMLETAGFDEATLARMRRATDGRIEAAVVRFMAAHDYEGLGTGAGDYAEPWLDAEMELREVACIIDGKDPRYAEPFSPDESQPAASVRQPQAETECRLRLFLEPGEAAWCQRPIGHPGDCGTLPAPMR